MDPAGGGAVTIPAIVAANRTTSSNVIVNANHQSNSHHQLQHQHQHHTLAHNNNNNSSSSNNSSSNNSLIISGNGTVSGGSSSSSSSSSTSSNSSSGYGSTSATPTNSYETHTAATTPVAIAEPIIPIATVAAVSPFYSEAISTQALESQHYSQQHHHHQQQPQQQQQQHTHRQQQYQQLLQNLQDAERPQYYSTYDYTQQQFQQQQQQPLPHHQQQQLPPQQQQPQVANNLSSTYNMGSGSPAYAGASENASTTGAAYQQGVAHQYKPTTAVASVNYDRQLSGRPAAASAAGSTAAANYQQHLQNESTPKPIGLSQHHQQFLGVTGSSSKSRSSNSLLGPSSSSSTTSTKPQAAATPFYAQPLAHQQQPSNTSSFYDQLKHKMPLDYHDNFTSFPNTAAYHQQQKYYAAAKSQLKEAASYGSPPGLPGKALYHNSNNFYAGPTAQHAGSLPTAGYDKYMYPSSYPALGYETSPETAYRKTSAASSLNSSSWPWGIDYAAGNSRTIPPPTGHLPTATVAPTHASYLAANSSHLARDPYYMPHDKYGKYPTPYQQAYVSPPATRHHLWSGTHAPLNERLAPPPPHALHTASPYFPSNAPSALNARQSCCAQPYQAQSCYYPPGRLTHGQPSAPPMGQASSAYMPTQPTAHHPSHLSPLSSSCKYGTVMDYGTGSKLKNPNDLYLSSHYDANNPPAHLTHPPNYQYSSAAAAANNQLYSSNQMHHGQQAARPLIAHDALANSATFTNDLSLSANNYDTYLHEPPSHLNHPQTSGPTAGYVPTAAKRALLDYRKPMQPQPPPLPPVPEESYVQHNQHTPVVKERYHRSPELLNTPETTTAFNEYDTQSQASGYAPGECVGSMQESTSKAGEETTKNLSLRDFIANWNDDEDDYAVASAASTAENLSFDQSTVINEALLKVSNAEPPTSTEQIPPPPLIPDKVSVAESVSKVAPLAKPFADEVDANQYANLPDIIIDIEKSNVNSSITTSSDTDQVVYSDTLTLDNFDVEKELDQLQQMRKGESDSVIVKQSPHDDIEATKETKTDIKPNNDEHTKSRDSDHPPHDHAKSLTTQISFDDLNLEPNKTVLSTRPPTASTATTDSANPPTSALATHTEQYFKEIEAYDSGNSHHSNESSLFEKEYETFINKITAKSESATKPESVTDFEQNVQDFSKFYKRKRKLKDDEVKSPQAAIEQTTKKLKSAVEEKLNNSNFPQVYTKKSRNRVNSLTQVKRLQPLVVRRRKPSSFYYKLMRTMRRYRLGRKRSKRVRDYIADLKEKHLPLIKRQSIKNYSIGMSAAGTNRSTPLSLKTLVLMVINSEEFRERLMIAEVVEIVDGPETEDRHMCVDPSCDTCDVIRSLMEPEAYQYEALEVAQSYDNEIVELCTYPAAEINELAIEASVILPVSSDKVLPAEVLGDPSEHNNISADIAERLESDNQLATKDSAEHKMPTDLESQLEYEVLNLTNVKMAAGVIIKTCQVNPSSDLSDSQTSVVEQNQTMNPIESQLSAELQGTDTPLAKSPQAFKEPVTLSTSVIKNHSTEDFELEKNCNASEYPRETIPITVTRGEECSDKINDLPDPQKAQATTVIRKVISKPKETQDESENVGSKQKSNVDHGQLPSTENLVSTKEVTNLSKPQTDRDVSSVLQNTEETLTTLRIAQHTMPDDLTPTLRPTLQTTTVIRKHESKPREADAEKLTDSKPLSNNESKAQSDDDDSDDGSESDTDSSSSCSSSDSSNDEDEDGDSSESDTEIESETLKILIKQVEICEKLSRGSAEVQGYDRVSVISGTSDQSNHGSHKLSSDIKTLSSEPENVKELSNTSITDIKNDEESIAKEITETSLKNNNFQTNTDNRDELESEAIASKDDDKHVVKKPSGIKRSLLKSKKIKSELLSSSDSSDVSEDELHDSEQRNSIHRSAESDSETPTKKPKLPEEPENLVVDCPLEKFADNSEEIPENHSAAIGNTPERHESGNETDRLESYHLPDYSRRLPNPNDNDMDKLFPHSPKKIPSDDEDLDSISPESTANSVSHDEELEKLCLEKTPANRVQDEIVDKFSEVNRLRPIADDMDKLFPHSPTKNQSDDEDSVKLTHAGPKNNVFNEEPEEVRPESPKNNVCDVGDSKDDIPESPKNNVSDAEDLDKEIPGIPNIENRDIEKLFPHSHLKDDSATPEASVCSIKSMELNQGLDQDLAVSPPSIATETREAVAEDTRQEQIIDISEDTSSSDDSEYDDSDNESLDEEEPTTAAPRNEITQIVDITEDDSDDVDEAHKNKNCPELCKSNSPDNLTELSEESRSSIETNSDDSEHEGDEDECKLNPVPKVREGHILELSIESNEENRKPEKSIAYILDKEPTVTSDKCDQEDSRHSFAGLKTSVIKSLNAPQQDQSETSPRINRETAMLSDEENSVASTESGCKLSNSLETVETPEEDVRSSIMSSPQKEEITEKLFKKDEENSVASGESVIKICNSMKTVETPEEDTRFSINVLTAIEETLVLQEKESTEQLSEKDNTGDSDLRTSGEYAEDIKEVEANKCVEDLERDVSEPQQESEYQSVSEDYKNDLVVSNPDESLDPKDSKEVCDNTEIQDDKTQEESATTSKHLTTLEEPDRAYLSPTVSVIQSNAKDIKDISQDGSTIPKITEESMLSEDSNENDFERNNLEPQPMEENSKEISEDGKNDHREEENAISEVLNQTLQVPQNQPNIEETEVYLANQRESHFKSVKNHNAITELECCSPQHRELFREDFADEVLDLSKDSKIFENSLDDNLANAELEPSEASLKENTPPFPDIEELAQIKDVKTVSMGCESPKDCESLSTVSEKETKTSIEALINQNIEMESDFSLQSPSIEDPNQVDNEEPTPVVAETPKESYGYWEKPSQISPAYNEPLKMADEEFMPKIFEIAHEPLKDNFPQSPETKESILMEVDAPVPQEPYESVKATSPQSPVIEKPTQMKDEEFIPHESKSSPTCPVIVERTEMVDEESPLKILEELKVHDTTRQSQTPKESHEAMITNSPIDDEESSMRTPKEACEYLATIIPQSATLEESNHMEDSESLLHVSERPKDPCECPRETSPPCRAYEESTEEKDAKSMLKLTENINSPAIEESAEINDEGPTLKLSETAEESYKYKEKISALDDVELMGKLSETSKDIFEHAEKTCVLDEPTRRQDEELMLKVPETPKELGEFPEINSTVEESIQTEEETSMLKESEITKDLEKTSQAREESTNVDETETKEKVSETHMKSKESLDKSSPQSAIIEEVNSTNSVECMATQSTTSEKPPLSHLSDRDRDYEIGNLDASVILKQTFEHSNDSSIDDNFPEAHNNELSKDSCHYSSSDTSKSSSSIGEVEEANNCDVSHPLTRSLHREASPEMNFWNTKGKYHTLRNYKSLALKSPRQPPTDEYCSGPQSSSGRLEGVTTPEPLSYTPRSESVMSGDYTYNIRQELNNLLDNHTHAKATANDLEDSTSLKNAQVCSPLDDTKMSSSTNEESTINTLDKTNEDLSTEFLGFKNQTSFDDASEDFHGFEDQHEEDRIRREIENLNEDSAANDAFPYATTCVAGKSPASNSDSLSSEFDELEALEKELSQHRLVKDLGGGSSEALHDDDEKELETEPHLVSLSSVIISTNDIEHIKKMLESDEEQASDEPDVEMEAKDKAKENIRPTNICIIPKLSDLCRAALNSSLNVNNIRTVQSNEDKVDDDEEEETTSPQNTISLNNCSAAPSIVVERELSVEEALAEMYRQAGVLLSDPEDNDNDRTTTTAKTAATTSTNEEAQDVLLINLHEILNSDNDNVFVLQCDMNVNDDNDDNDVDVDDNTPHSANEENDGNAFKAGSTSAHAERVNTLQLIGILNTDRDNSEIHIISSDSESEVIILSDCDTDVEFQAPAPPPPFASKRSNHPPRDYIPFINDLDTSDDSLSDLSTIHHEEIVPDNLHKFLQEEFYKYLHEKYAQKKLSKYYHANRVLRKYKKKVSNKFRQ